MKVFAALGAAFIVYLLVMAMALGSLMGGSASGSVAGGFPVNAHLAGLDAEAMRNVEISLQVADQLHTPDLAVMAMLDGGLGESHFQVVANGQGSGYCGVYQANPRNIACDDTHSQAEHFLAGGLGFQAGGAIHLAITQPLLTSGAIATLVEASGQPASFYDAHTAEAEQILAVWRSGSQLLAGTSGLHGLIAEAMRMTALHQPYVWGGGHAAFDPNGPWDCSGAISWLMHSQGMLDGTPLTSTGFMTWGAPGRGREFTIYANPIHVFMIVEAGAHIGQAWGTTNDPIWAGPDPNGGPAWHHHITAGFVARHYPGR